MNPGICYLYEYENKQKIRNVGFFKITRHYHSCILQIQARGIAVEAQALTDLYVFYQEGNDSIAQKLAQFAAANHAISARITVSESDFPMSRSLEEIDGFFLKLSGSDSSTFWVASPVAPQNILLYGEHNTPADNDPVKNNIEADVAIQEASPAPIEEETPVYEKTPKTQEQAKEEFPPRFARKIQRSDLSVLPKKYWFLANNSFLLHGYHNYNHLLLVEEEGHYWLGVPGIYDTREARAASLFGFPQFTRSYIEELSLSEEERNDDADFGHWCRYIK